MNNYRIKRNIETIELQMIGVVNMHKSLKEVFSGFIGQFFLIEAADEPIVEKQDRVKALLEEFDDIFCRT
jgi:hypothetical protein